MAVGVKYDHTSPGESRLTDGEEMLPSTYHNPHAHT